MGKLITVTTLLLRKAMVNLKDFKEILFFLFVI